jgi:hypothetical protein
VHAVKIDIGDEDIGTIAMQVHGSLSQTVLRNHPVSLKLQGRVDGPHKSGIIVNEEDSGGRSATPEFLIRTPATDTRHAGVFALMSPVWFFP